MQGVVKALFEHTMLPRVLAGSSVGSIVAGIVGTRTDDELRETFRKLDEVELSFFNNSRALELVHSFLQKGALHDMSYLQVRQRAGGMVVPVALHVFCLRVMWRNMSYLQVRRGTAGRRCDGTDECV